MNAFAKGSWPRAVLFDLDGTLIDSAPDLHASINRVLARHARGALSPAEVASMIGDGIRKLVERAFEATGSALSESGLDAAHAEMMKAYGAHLTVLTTLMPGAREAIAHCREAGARIGVATNKPQRPTEAILAHFGLADAVDGVIGGDTGLARKPAPDMVLALLGRLGAAPGDALMVGDSAADVESARAAGISVFALRGGYTRIPVEALGADRVIDHLGDLADAIADMRSVRSIPTGTN